MSVHLERLQISSERLVVVLLPLTVIAFVMGSSSVSWAMSAGGPLRWVMLCLLAAAAVPYGLSNVRAVPLSFAAVIGAFSLLMLLSTSWSVTTRLSFERAVSFVVLMAAVILLGAGAVQARARIEQLFLGIIVAVDLVAVAGLVLLVVDFHTSVQSPGPHMPARFRGFGQNPNTLSMLFALAIPLAEWLVVSARQPRVRAAAGLSCLLLYGEIMGSASRGALLASAFGTVLFVALATRPVRRLVTAEAVTLVFFLVTFQIAGHRPSLAPPPSPVAAPPVTTLPAVSTTTSGKPKPKPKPKPTTQQPHTGGSSGTSPVPAVPGPSSPSAPPPSTTPPASRTSVGVKPTLTQTDIPVPFVPRQDEIGHPLLYAYKPILGYGSGRVFAWLSAIRQGLHRPILGYGFGTESTVFVDRFYFFQGTYTENSFVGIFLQLGIAGSILLLLPFVLVGRALYRITRRSMGNDDRAVVAAAAGAVGGGFVVSFFQSYLYSVGNVATVTFWLSAVMAVTAEAFVRRPT